ncbi:MAG: hypothetical protein HY403_00985 [Elusimicrobia bacterium]|nr:hypothetical protein [Elusimicrobiota bacterium]
MLRLALGGTILFLAAAASALSPFLLQLKKAEARAASDPERVEFASRALRAWRVSDGNALLAHARFLRAEGEAALLDDAAAEEDLTKVLEIDPDNARARRMRAAARAALGRGAQAESDAVEYLAGKPEDAEGWLVLGEARLLQGPPKADRGARAAFAKAAALLGGEDPRPRLGEGRAHLSARRYREALACLSAAAERPRAREAEILSWRARAHSALGDWSAARDDLSAALPGLERALEELRRASAARRGQDAAHRALADAYFRRGLAYEALRAANEALADHRAACGLGLAPACARVKALEKAAPTAPPHQPKKTPRRKNPKGDPGDRIYAN